MSGCTGLCQLDTVPPELFCTPWCCPLCWSSPKPALGKISQLKLKCLNTVWVVCLSEHLKFASEVWVLHPNVMNLPRIVSKWPQQGVSFSVRGWEFSAAAFLHFCFFLPFYLLLFLPLSCLCRMGTTSGFAIPMWKQWITKLWKTKGRTKCSIFCFYISLLELLLSKILCSYVL